MKRHTQATDDLLGALREVPGAWEDPYARSVVAALDNIPPQLFYGATELRALLDRDFDVYMTVFQLVLDVSKDEWRQQLRAVGADKKLYKRDPDAFVAALERIGVGQELERQLNREWTWADIMAQRLKSGRGSAIKGQARGRFLESFVEDLLKELALPYEARCNFIGKRDVEAKCDFAVPSRSNPQIVIECKGYGSTGSKQTDVLGDIGKIIEARRADMYFLLVTDGLSWQDRASDLRKLVEHQNDGEVYRIYTQSMVGELREDLRQLGDELGV